MKALFIALMFCCAGLLAAEGQTISVYLSLDPASSGLGLSGTNIAVESFKLSAVRPATLRSTGEGAGVSQSQFSPMTIFKAINQNSPGLYLDCAQGRLIKSGTLTIQQTSGETAPPATVFQVVLTDLFISSMNDQGVSGGEEGDFLETITFNYRRIALIFTPPSGESQDAAFDLEKNMAIPFNSVVGGSQ